MINRSFLCHPMRPRFEKVLVGLDRSFHVEERKIARFDVPWHFHPELELTLIVASRGRRFVGDSIEPFAEGDLVLLGPNLPHFWHNEGRQPPGARAHSVVVQFRLDFLGAEIWTRPEFAAVRDLCARAARGLHFSGLAARRAMAGMRTLPSLKGLPRLLEVLAVLELLAGAGRARPLASAAYESSLDLRAEERLARVYAFLMRSFRDPLSLAQMARVAAMTPEAFSRYFKRATGRNVSVFLNELRIDDAGRLLRETPRRVADIAAEAGFPTLSNFNRRFRERTGCTPRAYREAFAERREPPATFLAVGWPAAGPAR
jgi:AraC-like DNA-binding protein